MVAPSSNFPLVEPSRSNARHNSAVIGRPLPSSLEAEELLLSCILLDGPEIIAKAIMAGIAVESFYSTAHGIIFEILLDLYTQQKPMDVSVVAEELKTRKLLDQVGGYAFLTQISRLVPTQAQASYFIEKVREQALLRNIIRSRTGSVEDCYSYTGNIDAFVAELTAREGAVTTQGNALDEFPVPVLAKTLREDFLRPKSQRKGISGQISWGLADLDERCGKLCPGDLVVLGGAPSSGKSALSDQMSWGIASSGKPAVIFTYEMSPDQKVLRMAQQIARLNAKQYDGAPVDKQRSWLAALEEIENCPHLHVFEKDRTLHRVVARCRTLHQKTPLGLIVVDFLQYLSRSEPSIDNERTDEKIGRISAALKALATDCQCPVLVLSSLNRSGYSNGANPGISSFKNSGEIESDADVAVILKWPDKHPRTGQPQDPKDQAQNVFYVEFSQEKGRYNGVHSLGLMFTRNATRFDCCSR